MKVSVSFEGENAAEILDGLDKAIGALRESRAKPVSITMSPGALASIGQHLYGAEDSRALGDNKPPEYRGLPIVEEPPLQRVTGAEELREALRAADAFRAVARRHLA